MDGLSIFWTVIFVASLFAFFGVAAIVTIRGWGDVKELFRHLSRENEKNIDKD